MIAMDTMAAAGRPGETKIDNRSLGSPARGDKNVLGLKVFMNVPFRVDCLERPEDCGRGGGHLGQGHRARLDQAGRQGLCAYSVHHEVRRAGRGFARPVHGGNVGRPDLF